LGPIPNPHILYLIRTLKIYLLKKYFINYFNI
jgi:hypothetical protein